MRQSEASTRNMEANVSDELKTCTWCGRECRVETFGPSEFIENPFSIWVCSNAEIFGGTCTRALAYMSEEDWQEEPRSDELIEAMARCLHDTSYPEGHLARISDWTGGEKYWRGLARSLLPVIRAHLEPTSEMVEAGLEAAHRINDKPIYLGKSADAVKAAIIAALAASPIGDVG